MTNILITGATGFVGAHLADYLSKSGYGNNGNKIYGLFRSFKKESTFNKLGLSDRKNVSLILGDVCMFPRVEEILHKYEIDTVYHLAAQSIVQTGNLSPVSTFQTNIFGTINLLEAIRKSGRDISTLVMSSDKAYGASDRLPYVEDGKERSCLNGLGVYSGSKACEDIIARTYSMEYKMPIVVARSANIFGQWDFNESRIIPQLISAWLKWKKYGDGRYLTINEMTSGQKREYIYVKDEVKALEFLMNDMMAHGWIGRAYNIGSGEVYSVDEIVKTFQSITGYSDRCIDYIRSDKKFKEIEEQRLDTSKLLGLGWKSSYKFEDGMKEFLCECLK